jgi:sorbitol-specific phosphotransferase system component IIA
MSRVRQVVPGPSFIRSQRVVSWVLTAGLACLLGLALPGSATAQEPPVAAYPFDEGTGEVAEDIYGNHDGTIENATWAEGKYGTALQFHGEEEDNCVTVPDSPELQLTENFTLEAWIRPEGSLFGDTILFKEFEELGGGASYAFSVGYGAKGKLEGTIIEEEEVIQTVTSPAALSEYKWAHVAFSFDGEKERLYVNGELVASHTASIGAIASSGPLEIGCAKGWESDYFWGKIDELRIYDRTLPEAEIKEDRDAAVLTPPSPDPVAAYPFDEGEGAVAGDFFGEHDGTVEGPTWAEGKYGTALQFQGWEESDCGTVPDSPELQLTENFTLEAWTRPEGSLFGDTILFKEFEAESGPTYVFSVGYSAKGKLEGTIIEGEETIQTVTSPKALAEYTWAHVAFSFDGEKERLYVNGELVASHTASIGAIASSGSLQIGCAKGWESDYFWGKIDELRIYGRTLSGEEIEADEHRDLSDPKFELTGALTEGLKVGTTNYPLKVTAVDGEAGRPSVGLGSVTISVDGEVVDSVEQKCPGGNCPLTREWTFSTSTFGFEPHRVVVDVRDVGGQEASQELQLAVPNGSVPACNPLHPDEFESTPDETHALSGGGTVAIYLGAEGMRYEFPRPPEGFNPITASDEELEEYGYPERPAGGAAREDWETAMSEVNGFAPAELCAGFPRGGTARYNGLSNGDTTTSEGWSGYVAFNSASENTWNGGHGIFTAAKLKGNHPRCPRASVSQWVGLGGLPRTKEEPHPLMQLGYEHGGDFARAFIETIPTGVLAGPLPFPLKINPGDRIEAGLRYSPTQELVHYWMRNKDTGEANLVTVPELDPKVISTDRRLTS